MTLLSAAFLTAGCAVAPACKIPAAPGATAFKAGPATG